jgi:hypothetical protein
VGFVDRVVPEAKYIYIRRDGLDAVGSALKCWKAKLDLPYILRKSRFVPVADLPYYAFRYFGSRLYRFFSREDRLAFWGPKLEGMEELLRTYSLEEVCAFQWKRCVDRAAQDLSNLSNQRWIDVAYEEFVSEPESGLEKVLEFLDVQVTNDRLACAVEKVSADSIGKGRHDLGEKACERLMPLLAKTMNHSGYVGQ